MPDSSSRSRDRESIIATIGGNRLQLIESGDERLERLLQLIDRAQQSIRILVYMFNPDWAGQRVRDALVAAAGRGLDVRLMIDGFGSGARSDFFKDLGNAGGHHCVFNPSYGRR